MTKTPRRSNEALRLKDNPRTSDLEQTTSPVDRLVRRLRTLFR